MKTVIRAALTAILLAALSFTSALALAPIRDTASETGQYAIQLASSDDVSADCVAYAIDDLDITVSIPTALRVFMQPIEADDPNLLFFGIKKEWVDRYFEENDIYLNAVSELVTYEIFVSSKANTATDVSTDFSTSSDADLELFIENSASVFQKSDETYDTIEVYRNEKTAYIRSLSEYTDESGIVYSVSYFTIQDGKAIDIYLNSYDNQLPEEREALLKNIVDSVSPPTTSDDGSLASVADAASPSPLDSADPQPSVVSASPDASTSDGASGQATSYEYIKLILIYLGITLIVVTLPVAVYRYIIRRRRVSKKGAVLISLIYGAVVSAAAYILARLYYPSHYYIIGGVVLWSVVNYFILSSGKDKPAPPPKQKKTKPKKEKSKISKQEVSDSNENPSFSEAVTSKQCGNCLAVNLSDSEECFYCGAKLGKETTANNEH